MTSIKAKTARAIRTVSITTSAYHSQPPIKSAEAPFLVPYPRPSASLRRVTIPRTTEQLHAQNRKIGILVDRLHDVAGRLADRGREIEDELSRKGDA